MPMRVATIVKVLKWTYICTSEIIGIAGVPDDVRGWGVWMPPIADFLDQWIVRALLVLSGIAVITYGRWKPMLAGPVRRRLAKPTSAECIQMAEELYELLEHRFDAYGEYIEGSRGKSIKINLLDRRFRGRMRAQGKECPARYHPYDYELKQWLLDYIETESAALNNDEDS